MRSDTISRRRLLGVRATSGLAAACLIVCLVAVVVAASGASPEAAAGRALLELLVVGVPLAAGWYALRAAPTAPFGVALLAIGFVWSLTALAESPVSGLYTIGRISTWLIFPGVVFLLLAFPDGRIAPGLDQAILVGVIAVAAFLFIGTAPFVADFPPLTVWATCDADCPPNALFILDRPPEFLPGLILVREWLVLVIWIGLFTSMALRWRRASPLQRRVVAPVFVAGVALGLTHVMFHLARQLGAPPQLVIDLSWLWALCVVAICAAILFAVLWRRALLTSALARLGTALRASDRPLDVRAALAEALTDPTLELLYRDRATATWHDDRDVPVHWPRELQAHRIGTVVSDGPQEPEIVMVHDVALSDDPELLAGVAGMILAGRRHQQLAADLASAMDELDDSGRRIADAADVERQRIVRDLHDGAQQRLVALRIRLALAESRSRKDPVGGMEDIHELGTDVEAALEEIRSLARGVFPAPLVDGGLVAGIRSLAASCPVPVRIETAGVTRLPAELESAVYFACAEALQNTAKHATGATDVMVTLEQSPDELRFEVRDDGPGFVPGDGPGQGLRNMRDRIASVGGELSVGPAANGGTRVSGTIALVPRQPGTVGVRSAT